VQAAVLTSFGGPESLVTRTIDEPKPRAGWTTVRLRASALNWHDVLVRQGRYRSPLPHVIGADGAGIATDSGEEVVILPSLHWGDDESAPAAEWQILGDTTAGTYAELVSVPTSSLLPKPAGLSWLEAAALPLVGTTTYRALFSRGRLTAGESLLVLGAGGGVATMAVALATGIGAEVIVTSSSEQKIAQAVDNGARDGVLYSDPDWADAARRLSPGGHGFDVVLDSVGTWADSIRALKPGGRLVVLGASRAERASLDIRPFYFGQYDILGTTMGSARDLRGLLSLMESTPIAPPIIDRVFPLDEAALAHEHLEGGGSFGKIVLSVA
jgi:zinc-binding alcohol dehydrogenase/oxidoreductase